ncbi:hypothetical protein SAMN05216184_101189 [Georgenia satyanarayanai]|uniref:Lipoprotein LpqB beta-propeller domain-containing protein n=1 Tax=Georgenia satyanarayanai TaxID=860221 RepID=A0A2Y8ZX32_9MICO|nr:hypothetical protein [Georgenia satyanarayanai]PYG01725.1 hypothetical protein A8987_101189 [Georgenia satyanarayanai]SSA36525.1 hypothetical protein SAMN05216184_101189 [Georgenia satyanarayanai]
MPRHRLLALGTLAVLAVSACDGADPTAVAAGRNAPPAEAAVAPTDTPAASPALTGPDGSPLSVTELDIPAPDDAAEVTVEVLRTLSYREGEDATVTPRAVSPSGEVLISTTDPGSFDGAALELLATTPVHLWTEEGLDPLGSTEALVPGDAHRQVVSATFAGGSPAWHETTGLQAGTSDWRMVARPGAAPVLLARSEQLFPAGELPGLAGHPRLTAAGDRVGWETVEEREDGTLRTRLVSVPVSGGELRTEAELATMPAGAADGWVTVRVEDRDVVGVDEDGGPLAAQTSIDVVTPGGDTRTLVELHGGTVSQLAAGGGQVLAWADQTDVYVGTTGRSAVQRLVAAPGTSVVPSSLAVCGEHVVWAASSTGGPATTYVLHPATGRAGALPAVAGDATIVCGGPYLAWTQVDDGGGEHVVTLARLAAPTGAG